MDQTILFHYENTEFKIKDEPRFVHWILKLCNNHGLNPECINYIFADDEYVLAINREHLDHDFYTDIITFPISKKPLCIDIYISVDRVKENAISFEVDFENELKRVMAHGVLHVAGFGDKTKEEAKLMRQEEDRAIELYQ